METKESIKELYELITQVDVLLKQRHLTKTQGRLMNNFLTKLHNIIKGDVSDNEKFNNANKDSSVISVKREELAETVLKEIALQTLPKHIVEAHHKGEIYMHDLGFSPISSAYNCALIDLKAMLDGGIPFADVTTKKPTNITTACNLTVQAIAGIASAQYGGIGLNNFEKVMAEYVSLSYERHLSTGLKFMCRDKAVVYATEQTHKETYDAIQNLEYSLNSLTSTSAQVPFVTLGFGLGTSWQERLIQKSILEVRLAKLNGRVAVFPKLVYLVEDGVNVKPSDVNYDIRKLAIKCSAECNYPDVLNMDTLRKNGGGATIYGCRASLSEWRDEEGQLVWDGRANAGVVSLNLPRIAFEAGKDISKFYTILDERMNIAKEGLALKINRLKTVQAKEAPIIYMSGALGKRYKANDYIFDVFDKGRGTASIGFVGLHETALLMFGEHAYDCEDARLFTIDVLKHMRKHIDEWNVGYSMHCKVGLYGTPAETLNTRFHDLDLNDFGCVEGVTGKGFYTNSFMLDVEKKVSQFCKVDFEKPYHKMASAGNISFVELPALTNEYKEVMIDELWKYTFDKIPYFAVNNVINRCFTCNTQGQVDFDKSEVGGFYCKCCGEKSVDKLHVTMRVCGYIASPVQRPVNIGKQKEMKRRVKHVL